MDRIARGLLGAQPTTALTDERAQLMAMLLRGQGGLIPPTSMQPMGGLLGFGDRMQMPPIYQPPTTSGTRGYA